MLAQSRFLTMKIPLVRLFALDPAMPRQFLWEAVDLQHRLTRQNLYQIRQAAQPGVFQLFRPPESDPF
ncbi:MAG: hypothetical protein A3G20_02390 [Acidobacteria bacterium RIFCSPLOWO2_12_FULL_59_11]|nr:MAG: hypothetical protein A3G20_02390 [Acidobacteria bacterium RIFCSPLOWO2_12_FULL_59_11]